MAVMHQATIVGNAQYMVYINSDKNSQQTSSDTKKSEKLKIVKRFEVNWKFYKGKLTSDKRLQIAV